MNVPPTRAYLPPPDTSWDSFVSALERIAKSRGYDQAAAAVTRSGRGRVENAQALAWLALVSQQGEKRNPAIGHGLVAEAEQLMSNDAFVLEAKGKIFFFNYDYADALEAFGAALRAQPALNQQHSLLGHQVRCLHKLGMRAEALGAFSKMTALPSNTLKQEQRVEELQDLLKLSVSPSAAAASRASATPIHAQDSWAPHPQPDGAKAADPRLGQGNLDRDRLAVVVA